MPRITQNSKGGVISFGAEDFLAGHTPQHSGGTQTVGNGAATMTSFDPFRNYGAAYPGAIMSDLGNVSVIDAVQKNCVVNNGATPYAYTVGGTKVHQINISTDSITTPTTFPHAVTGSTMEDCVIYRYGGTKYLMYSYYDGTDLEIGTYDFATTFNDTFWSSTLSNNSTDQNVPHPMIVGPDGNLYIGDGRFVAAIYGDLSQSSTAAVSLPSGWVITSFSKTSTYLIIYAYKSEGSYTSNFYRGECSAFFWDLVPDNNFFTDIYDLEDNYVNGGFVWRGVPGCFTTGRGKMGGRGYTAMRLFDGSKFVAVEDCIISETTVPPHGGVEIMDDMVHFVIGSARVYSYGAGVKGQKDILLKRFATGGTGVAGFVRNVSLNVLYTSDGITTAGGLKKTNPSNPGSGSWVSPYAFPAFNYDEMGEIEYVQIKFIGPNSAGGNSLDVTIGMVGGTTQTLLLDVDTITVLSTAETATSKKVITSTNTDTSGVTLQDFIGVRASMVWDATTALPTATPAVKEINIFYKNRKISN